MPTVTFQAESGEAVTIATSPGENILDLARKANVPIDAPCSGNGSCGKCRMRLLQGAVDSLPTIHIDKESHGDGWRLACASSVSGDVVLLTPDIASAYRSRLRVTDLSSPEELAAFDSIKKDLKNAGFHCKCSIDCLAIALEHPTLDDTRPDNERLARALAAATGTADIALPFPVLQKLPAVLRESRFKVLCVFEKILNHIEIIDIKASPSLQGYQGESTPATRPPCLGIAFDIGTTTVSGLLVDLETGEILARGGTGNGQIRYGADVIHRVMEQEKPGGVARLQKAVVEETLNPLIDSLCRAAGVERESVYRLTAAGNTTMEHLLLGIPASGVRMEPYIPAFFEIPSFPVDRIGIPLGAGARLRLAPNIGSYVGGDITAGTLASRIWNRPELSMLIDLGTNGEIVVGNNEFLMACACSAGPAFEGGDISCGMRATDGAVEACKIDAGTLEPTLAVIGGGAGNSGAKPVGLCGSGIIEVIAGLFTARAIDGRGKFIREGRRMRQDEFGIGSYVLAFADESATCRDIAITEVDIDNFIRAKGAIFSAIMTLLDALGFTPADIQKIFVAGGIGSGIDIPSAIRIGMFPNLPTERYRTIGNSSLTGAYATLVSEDAATKLREIAHGMTYMELSAQPGYMDAFVAACFLPHTAAALFGQSGSKAISVSK